MTNKHASTAMNFICNPILSSEFEGKNPEEYKAYIVQNIIIYG